MSEEEKEYLEKMSLSTALEIADKYANDMFLFSTVNKEVVGKVCELLLTQLQAYKDKEDKLREYVRGCTEEEYGADYFVIKDYFQGINEIIDGSEEE